MPLANSSGHRGLDGPVEHMMMDADTAVAEEPGQLRKTSICFQMCPHCFVMDASWLVQNDSELPSHVHGEEPMHQDILRGSASSRHFDVIGLLAEDLMCWQGALSLE